MLKKTYKRINSCEEASHFGFLLIEIVVVLGIISIILSIGLISQRDFSERITLENNAQEIELIIYQAKAFALGVRRSPFPNNSFNVGYGVHFRENDQEYIFYSFIWNEDKYEDEDEMGKWWDILYGGGGEYEILSTFSIDDNNFINSISCDGNGLKEGETLSVTFRRPRPDATIIRNIPGIPSGFEECDNSLVTISSVNFSKTFNIRSKGGLVSFE